MFTPIELKTRAKLVAKAPGKAVMVLRERAGWLAVVGSRIIRAHSAVSLIRKVQP